MAAAKNRPPRSLPESSTLSAVICSHFEHVFSQKRPTGGQRHLQGGAEASSKDQPVLATLLDHLTNRGLALSADEALLLTLHQLLQVTPHLHLLHVGTVVLPYHFLLLTELLESKVDREAQVQRKRNDRATGSFCCKDKVLTLPKSSCSEMFFIKTSLQSRR